MLKKVIYFIVMIILAVSCKWNEKYITINGKLENIEDGTYLYLRELNTYQLIDSIQVSNGTFSYKSYSSLNKSYILHNKRNQYSFRDRKLIWLDSENIMISGDYNFLLRLKIENSPTQKMQMQFNNELSYFANKIDSLRDVLSQNEENSAIEPIIHQAAESLLKYPDFFLNDYFITLLLYPPQYFNQTPLRTYYALDIYNLLPIELKNIEYDEKFNKYSILQFIPLVQKAIDIEQQTPQGETIRLSDLEGKYVLIDFWASWCVPCRKSFDELKNVYAKYNSKGFEVYSVSWDDNKSAWVNAIVEDSIPWINVSDFNGKKNKAFLDYEVTGVPTNFLVDKNGVIIMRGFHDFKLLDKELSEIFRIKE